MLLLQVEQCELRRLVNIKLDHITLSSFHLCDPVQYHGHTGTEGAACSAHKVVVDPTLSSSHPAAMGYLKGWVTHWTEELSRQRDEGKPGPLPQQQGITPHYVWPWFIGSPPFVWPSCWTVFAGNLSSASWVSMMGWALMCVRGGDKQSCKRTATTWLHSRGPQCKMQGCLTN